MPNQYDKKWTEKEIEILKKFYYRTPKEELRRMLPGRTWATIVTKAHLLGLKRWRKYKEITLTEVDKAWLACAIDGEGTISIYPPRKGRDFRPLLALYNTNQEFVEKFAEMLGISNLTKKRQRRKWKVCYSLRIEAKGIILRILELIYPYLIIKKRHAELVIDAIKNNNWELNYRLIKRLNK